MAEDPAAWGEMARFGIKMVPIVTKNADWANGQVLRDIARIAEIDLGDQKILPPAELARRIDLILTAEQRYFAQMPEDKMQGQVPGRARSFANLTWHTFNVVDAFLELEVDGQPLTFGAYNRNAPDGKNSKADILAYGAYVQQRFRDWWREQGPTTNFDEMADVYYGDQSKHDFMERTTWHSGQHTRQMMMILETFIGVKPIDPLGPEMWVGLPMPEKVWDDEKPIA